MAYALTGSAEAAGGCFAGGFLIDVDHYADYLVFEKQWRRPGPLTFLRYYFTYSPKRLVLPLHSWELMGGLKILILLYPVPLLVGYWLGALMHLAFDVVLNGENALKKPLLFYSFVYRLSKRFAAVNLLDVAVHAEAGKRPIREFFRWRPVRGDEAAASASCPDKSTLNIAS